MVTISGHCTLPLPTMHPMLMIVMGSAYVIQATTLKLSACSVVNRKSASGYATNAS